MRVCVVGGGAAGLAAAKLAREHAGVSEVVVFEASGQVGGRCRSVTLAGTRVDAGASWIHGFGEGNEAARLAGLMGLEVVASSALPGNHVVFKEESRGRVSSHALDKARAALKAGKGVDQLTGEQCDAYHFLEQHMENWEGGPLGEIGEEEYGYEDLPGPHVVLVEGYQRMMEILAEDTTVRLNSPVTRIERLDEGVRVWLDEEPHVFDRCVVALPCGVLQVQETLFEPYLPERQTALAALGPGIVQKLILVFNEVFWRVSTFGSRSLYVSSLELAWGAPVLVVWERSTHPERDAHQVAAELMRFWNAGPSVELLATHHAPWPKDELTRGAYSYPKRGCPLNVRDILARPHWDGSLQFCGEYVSKRHFGTVHGALESARGVCFDNE